MNNQPSFDFSSLNDEQLIPFIRNAESVGRTNIVTAGLAEYQARNQLKVEKDLSHDKTATLLEMASSKVNDFISGLSEAKERINGKNNTFSGNYQSQALAAQQPAIANSEEVPEQYQTYDQAKLTEVDSIVNNIDSNPDYWGMSRDEIYNSLRGQDAIDVGISTITLPIAPTSLAGAIVTGGVIGATSGIAKDLTKDNAIIDGYSLGSDLATGSVIGAGGHILGSALGSVANRLTNTSPTKARNLIRQELRNKVDAGELDINALRSELTELASGNRVGGVNLADSGMMDDILNKLSKGQKVPNDIIDGLTQRAKSQRDFINDTATTKPEVGSEFGLGVNGTARPIRTGEVNDGSLDTGVLAKNLVDDLNLNTKPLYESAYTTKLTTSDLPTSLKNSPAFKAALKEGRTIARNTTDNPSNFEVLDQTKRALDIQISEATGANRVGLIRRKEELVNVLRDKSPEYAQALDTQTAYRNDVIANINKGESFLGLNADTSTNVLNDLLSGNAKAATVGMNKVLRDRIANEVRTSDGKLLTDKQSDIYQRMFNQSPSQQTNNLKRIISTEAAMNRTANLAKLDRSSLEVESLVDSLTSRLKNPSTALSAVALAVNPNFIGASILASKMARAKGKTHTPKQAELIKDIQTELFKSIGSNRRESQKYLDDFLSLKFEDLPIDVIQKFAGMTTNSLSTQSDTVNDKIKQVMF
ncbi:hypothetical protein C9I87_09110 [Photobacterium iliopiscarium]|uniref:hypothetical protein n=1 Tax=Photobacterium iliopiscarium TaxID=56192 RepID=UPI000D176DFE|nr:hypothetical protein [Photobacterium iliopiscarium]PST95419.1 hypothetical protein C9I87_09110 [Photobacterium iliopiscarium]